MSARAAALAALLALAAAAAAPAAQPGFSSRPHMDWEAGTLSVEVSFDLDPATDSLPRAKWDAEMEIEARRAAFLMDGVAGVLLDSARTFADAFASDPSLEQSIRGRVLEAPREALFLSPDLRRVVARYTVPFFGEKGVAAALAHGRETPIRRQLGYTASREFTGIVISARGRLPSQGTADQAVLRPALFPRFFDQDMRLVLDRSMVSPEALVRWGMAGYADEMDASVVALRGGANPLRIAARAVFGKNSADIVIPAEAARQILTVTGNIDLLRDGKIVVVLEDLD
jgi:hypothetical protein